MSTPVPLLRYSLAFCTLALLFCSCINLNAPDDGDGSDPGTRSRFNNVSASNLPAGLSGSSTSAESADLDGDGDIDLAVALRSSTNKVLFNDGSGSFGVQSLVSPIFDSRDIIISDFNDDNFPDLFFANNSTQSSELYLNNSGEGSFSNLSNRIPVTGPFTSAAAEDIDGDNITDLLIGNDGQNQLLQNTGNAFFNSQTVRRLPRISDPSQDVAIGDLTTDGLLDIVVANTNGNKILVNTGSGFFNDQSNRYPYINQAEESRDVELVDIDDDGDFDIYVANSNLQGGANPQDRLLINDGSGFFSDATSDRLPTLAGSNFDAEFADLDGDGHLDIAIGNYLGGLAILINNGNTVFTNETDSWVPESFAPRTMDLEIADFNADSLPDIYVSVRDGADQLLLQKSQ